MPVLCDCSNFPRLCRMNNNEYSSRATNADLTCSFTLARQHANKECPVAIRETPTWWLFSLEKSCQNSESCSGSHTCEIAATSLNQTAMGNSSGQLSRMSTSMIFFAVYGELPPEAHTKVMVVHAACLQMLVDA